MLSSQILNPLHLKYKGLEPITLLIGITLSIIYLVIPHTFYLHALHRESLESFIVYMSSLQFNLQSCTNSFNDQSPTLAEHHHSFYYPIGCVQLPTSSTCYGTKNIRKGQSYDVQVILFTKSIVSSTNMEGECKEVEQITRTGDEVLKGNKRDERRDRVRITEIRANLNVKL